MQFEELKELIAIFEKSDINDMKIHFDNASIHLSRGNSQTTSTNTSDILTAGKVNSPENGNESISEEKKELEENINIDDKKYIKAPIVGTFYQAASPEEPPYVTIGDRVKKGDIVCIIEAMKFMNEVTSEQDGEILEVLVKDGEFVEYGAPLFKFK